MADPVQQAVRCEICPKTCLIRPGQSGECRIRVNVDGQLQSVTYGRPCAIHVDPIEKKPFFHYLPGTEALSLATVGCNLHCKNCQNWEISQANPEDMAAYSLSPSEIPALARKHDCLSVAGAQSQPRDSRRHPGHQGHVRCLLPRCMRRFACARASRH